MYADENDVESKKYDQMLTLKRAKIECGDQE